MDEGRAGSGSPPVPLVFVGVPWLGGSPALKEYLPSCLSHIENQDTDIGILPTVVTEEIDPSVKVTKENQMTLVSMKLNTLIEEMLETEATHLWLVNADTEVPRDALSSLMSLKGAVVSGISPMHLDWKWSDVFIWVPAPSPEQLYSEPYFKRLPFHELRGKVFGGDILVAAGHFCMLVQREVLEQIRFRWRPSKVVHCPECSAEVRYQYQRQGAELTFWMDAYMMGFMTYVDGRVVVGHLPEHPLADYEAPEESEKK